MHGGVLEVDWDWMWMRGKEQVLLKFLEVSAG